MILGGSRRSFAIGLLLADLVAIQLSLVLAYAIRYSIGSLSAEGMTDFLFYALAGLLAAGLWILVFVLSRMGEVRTGWRLPNIVSHLFVGSLVGGLCFLAGIYFTKLLYSRLILILWAVIGFSSLILVRILFWRVFSTWQNLTRQKVLLLGSLDLVLEAAAKIRSHPELLYELVGVFCLENEAAGLPIAEGTESRTLVSALGLMAEKGIDEIFVLISESPNAELVSFLSACRDRNIRVRILPHPYELYVSKVELSDLEGMPLLEITGHDFSPWGVAVKRTFDVVVGALLLVLLAPVMLLIAGSLVLRGRRPVIRREVRIGRNGVSFPMLRFNVAAVGKEAASWEGKLLRYSLLDLPQLFNVLAGQMSLVGPRPEGSDRFRNYSEWHRRRLQVTPGITGLAQVHGLREQDSTDAKIRFDLQYVAQWSLLQDILLIVETGWALLKRTWKAESASPVHPETPPKSANSAFAEKAGG